MDSLFELLPFSDYCIHIVKDELNSIQGSFDLNSIDKLKLLRKLNLSNVKPFWFEFNEIASNPLETDLQLDLLGNLKEPCVIFNSSKEGYQSHYLIKLKPSRLYVDMDYGKDQKALIEIIIIQWLEHLIQDGITDTMSPETFIQVSKNQAIRIDQLNDRLSKEKLGRNSLIEQFCNYILRDKLANNRKVLLSNSALEYLNENELSLDELELMANTGYEIANTLDPDANEIVIKKYYFVGTQEEIKGNKIPEEATNTQIFNSVPSVLPDFVEEKLATSAISKPLGEEATPKPVKLITPFEGDRKLDKTMSLLNRYEKAVEHLLNDKLPVMGKNIAAACDPVISAPALTDSIKNTVPGLKPVSINFLTDGLYLKSITCH